MEGGFGSAFQLVDGADDGTLVQLVEGDATRFEATEANPAVGFVAAIFFHPPLLVLVLELGAANASTGPDRLLLCLSLVADEMPSCIPAASAIFAISLSSLFFSLSLFFSVTPAASVFPFCVCFISMKRCQTCQSMPQDSIASFSPSCDDDHNYSNEHQKYLVDRTASDTIHSDTSSKLD